MPTDLSAACDRVIEAHKKMTPGRYAMVAGPLTEIKASDGPPVVNWLGFDDSDRSLDEHRANAHGLALARNVMAPLAELAKAAEELVLLLESIPERDLLSLDNDKHPPSSISVSCKEFRKAAAAFIAAVRGDPMNDKPIDAKAIKDAIGYIQSARASYLNAAASDQYLAQAIESLQPKPTPEPEPTERMLAALSETEWRRLTTVPGQDKENWPTAFALCNQGRIELRMSDDLRFHEARLRPTALGVEKLCESLDKTARRLTGFATNEADAEASACRSAISLLRRGGGIEGWTGKPCPRCGGSGDPSASDPEWRRHCPACAGTGEEYSITPAAERERSGDKPSPTPGWGRAGCH